VNVDLLVLGFVALFAVLGAVSGAAKQISRLIAAIGAGVGARFAAPFCAPFVAKQLTTSRTTGLVIASLLLFLLAFFIIRWAVHTVVLRVLAGKDMKERGLDRVLGFILGGVRVAAIAWFLLCAIAFLEDNVSIAGNRLSLAPKGSVLFQLARHHNLFALAEVPGLHELVEVGRAAWDPYRAEAMKKSPAFAALKKDARFRSALDAEGMRKAFEDGDYRAIMQNADVMRLLGDPNVMKQLEEASSAADR
jgi:membrane protein required for colicin V production